MGLPSSGGREQVARAKIELDVSGIKSSSEIAVRASRAIKVGLQQSGEQADKLATQLQNSFKTIDTSKAKTAIMGLRDSVQKLPLDFDRLKQSVDKFSQSAQTQFGSFKQKISGAVGSAINQLKKLNNVNFGGLKNSLNDLQGRLQRISVPAGIFTGLGLKAAQDIKLLNATFTALIGDEQKATQELAKLKALADRTGQSFLESAKAGQALAASVTRAGGDLTQAVSIAQRLAILDPVQGVEGASIAIKEFLSGDYISLVRRFELSRSELKQLRDQSKGDVNAMLASLSGMVDGLGLTEQALNDMAADGTFAFTQLRSTITLTLAQAFDPLLNEYVVPATEKLNAFITKVSESNPELLSLGAGLAAVVAVAPAVVFGVTQITNAIIAMRAAASNPIVIKAGLTLAALGLGAKLGIEISKMVGKIIGSENLQTASFERIGETAKQLLAIFGFAVLEAKDVLQKGALVISTVLQAAGNAIEKQFLNLNVILGDAKDFFERQFAQLGAVFGILITRIRELIADVLPGDAEKFGGLKSKDAERLRNAIAQQLAQDIEQIDQRGENRRANRDIRFEQIDNPLAAERRQLEDQVANLTKTAENYRALLAQVNENNEVMVGGVAVGQEQIQKSLLETTLEMTRLKNELDNLENRDLSPLEQFNQISRDTEDQQKDWLKSLGLLKEESEKTAEANEKAAAALAEAQESRFSDAQLEAFAELQDAISEIEKTAEEERLAEISEYNERRQALIEDFNADNLRREEDHARDIAQAKEKYDRDREKLERDASDKLIEIGEKANQDRIQAQEQFGEKWAESVEKQQRDIEQIQRESNRKRLEAAGALDAKTIFEERRRTQERINDRIRSGEEQRQKEQSEFQKRLATINEREQEQLNTQQRNLQKQLINLQENFNLQEKQRAENFAIQQEREQERYREQLAQEDNQHKERLNTIRQQAAQEREQLNQGFREEFNANLKHQNMMLNIQRKGQAQLEQELAAWWIRQNQLIKAQQSQTSSSSKGGFTFKLRPKNTVGRSVISARDSGGTVLSGGAYNLQRGETVLRPEISDQIKRLLGNSMSQQGIVAALQHSRTVNNQNLTANMQNSFNINGNQDGRALEQVFQNALMGLFRQVANAGSTTL